MGPFARRTYTDGVLDTRGYKLRCFVENLACAAVAPALLTAGTLLIGGGIARRSSRRWARACLRRRVATDWLFRNPILPD